MKTVGEIIHSERVKRNLSLEQLSHLTKIDIKYLEAIEKNNFSSLPSETFIKGFIRNISLRIDKNPDELVAIFRRDFKQTSRDISKPKVRPHTKINFDTSKYLPIFLGTLVFVVYLIFQFRSILTPPKLSVTRPTDGSVLVSPLDIEGDTSVDAFISIGEDIQTRPDENGHFTAKISLPIGETTLEIKATNRFSRSAVKKIPLTIISK